MAEPGQQVAAETPDNAEPPDLDEIQLPPHVILGLRAVEREFEAQSKGPDWSPAMESRIFGENSLAASGVEVTDVRVDCRTTLCRVQLTLPRQAEGALRPPAAPGSTPSGRPSPIFLSAEAVDLNFRIVVGAFDGYGTPVTLGFLERGDGGDAAA